MVIWEKLLFVRERNRERGNDEHIYFWLLLLPVHQIRFRCVIAACHDNLLIKQNTNEQRDCQDSFQNAYSKMH